MRLLAHADRIAQPWRNGGGETSEIARSAPTADSSFDWRVSLATIARDGEFSRYEGIDRIIMALGPDPLTLTNDGSTVVLSVHDALLFPGEADVSANRVLRPGYDLNVMVDRRRFTATLTPYPVTPGWSICARHDEITLLVAITPLRLSGDRSLRRFDGLALEAGERIAAEGSGHLAVARICAVQHQ